MVKLQGKQRFVVCGVLYSRKTWIGEHSFDIYTRWSCCVHVWRGREYEQWGVLTTEKGRMHSSNEQTFKTRLRCNELQLKEVQETAEIHAACPSLRCPSIAKLQEAPIRTASPHDSERPWLLVLFAREKNQTPIVSYGVERLIVFPDN